MNWDEKLAGQIAMEVAGEDSRFEARALIKEACRPILRWAAGDFNVSKDWDSRGVRAVREVAKAIYTAGQLQASNETKEHSP